MEDNMSSKIQLLRQMIECPICHVGHIPQCETLMKNGVYAGTCANCGHFFKFRSVAPYRDTITVTINGTKCTVGNEYDPATSLNEYLQASRISTGTKYMCREGGCGMCVVEAKLYDVYKKKLTSYAINSCLCPLYICDGWEITTIEGIGSKQKGYHPIQQRLADYNGTQCGFCSPGQVMNMYALLERNPSVTKQEVEDSFGGVLCRCTGYRSILDAMKSFAVDSVPNSRVDLLDIEDLDKKICKKNGGPCTGSCEPKDSRSVHLVLATAQWFHPSTLHELYSLMVQYKAKSQKLVFGSTGSGIYKEIGPWSYDVLMDLHGIEELQTVRFADVANIGSSVTLTQLIDIFSEVDPTKGFAYLKSLVEHIEKVAHTNVRNSGTWAGNMMLKHQFLDFPSDIFVMLETISAQLCLGGPCEKIVSLLDFLDMDMTGKVILYMILPQMSTDTYIRTYKVMPRSQNALAYVNAGYRMELDVSNNFLIKQKPSIVYGGISKSFVHAAETENYLQGKQLGNPNVIKGALNILSSEIDPDVSPGLSSAEYRKSLALALFYRYVLSVLGDKVGERYRSGGSPLCRPLSSGQQSYDTKKIEWPLTQPMPKLAAVLQTSGEAEFITDMPPKPGQLYASFVLSTVGNAQIQSIDPSEALKMAGVVKFVSSSDIPKGGTNNFMPGLDPEELLCSSEILFTNQAVGIIIAEDQITADSGAKAVKVTYTDIQPPITNIQDGIKQKSFFPKTLPDLIVGDAEKAIADSPKKITGTIGLGAQYHFHTETQISICSPTEDGMDVWTSTQWIDGARNAIASVLGIEKNSINMEVKRLGGAFGAKITRSFQVAAGCALAASIMNRPIRMMLNIHDNMGLIGKRYPYYAEYEVGVTCEGQLNGIKMSLYGDFGSSANDGNNDPPISYIDNAYYCPNWHVMEFSVKTNTPPNTLCRAPGSAPAIFIMENVIEQVAKSLGKVPSEVKHLNLYKKGQVTPIGMKLDYCNISTLMTNLEQSAEVETRQQQIQTFNQANRWKKKALSVMPMKFGIIWFICDYSVYLAVYSDGTVSIAHGGIECGQGINTKVAQVCAYELKIPLNTIKIKPATSFTNTNSSATSASITSELNCQGVIQCCQILVNRMALVKAKMVDPTWQQLVTKCLEEGIDLTTRYFVHPKPTPAFQYNSYGVTCTEVELDVLTGENQISRVDLLYDCGESMNPEIDIGQAEGAFVFGLGYWMLEEMKFDPTSGQLINNNTLGYHVPTSKDIPIDFRVQLLKNAPNPVGILRSKTAGEPPLCMSASALFALKHAVEAARAEIGKDTYFPLDAPATVEKLQTNCLLDTSQFVIT